MTLKFAYCATIRRATFALAVALSTLGAVTPQVHAQAVQPGGYTGVSVQASAQVFDVMCALDAAGFDPAHAVLGDVSPARLALRNQLAALNTPATAALRQFYKDHALGDTLETFSRYMTFAIVAGPPPDFAIAGDRDTLPPDVLALDGFQQVLAGFYRDARLEARWREIQAEYESQIEPYNIQLARTVTVVNAYLREVTRPSSGRSFTVEIEPSVGGRTNFRNFGDAYSIIVGPVSDDSADVIRHAYLHFVIDPFVLRNRSALDKHRAALDIAARDPQLPDQYQSNIVDLLDESTIKAVELRLNHLRGEQLEAALQSADASGFVLVRPLVAQLVKFEKAEPAMSYYFGDIVTGLDADTDRAQLQKLIAQAPAEQAPTDKTAVDPAPVVDQWLAEGEREIAQRDGQGAAAAFQKVLEKTPNDTRAIYGLALAYVLSGRAEEAGNLFEKVISIASANGDKSAAYLDPTILAWSHVYLGRMHDLAGDRDLALDEYKAASTVDGAAEATRAAAQEGMANPYEPPRREGTNSQQ